MFGFMIMLFDICMGLVSVGVLFLGFGVMGGMMLVD